MTHMADECIATVTSSPAALLIEGLPLEMLVYVSRRLGAPERAALMSLPDLDGDGRPETLKLLSQPLMVRETEYSSLVPIPLEGGQELYLGSYCREVTAEGGIVGIVIMSDPNVADFQIVTLRTKTTSSACVDSLLSKPPRPRPVTPQSATTPSISI